MNVPSIEGAFKKAVKVLKGCGGESNAKTHLVLTPVVFVLAVEHRHFCLIRGKKQQIPRRKKAYRRLFRAGAEQ